MTFTHSSEKNRIDGEVVKKKSKGTNNKLELTVQSQTSRLKEVRQFVARAARHSGFSVDEAGKIALAVDEACTNIIKHAYNFAEDQDIHLRVSLNDGTFEILITDHGKSFDPGSVKLPDMREYVSQYRQGGLGMYLMTSLMDKVEYRMRPGRENQVRLIKYLPHSR
jgi:serine/threonine-protein kinase RsbW